MEKKAERAVGGRRMLLLGAGAAILVVIGAYMILGRSHTQAPITVGADGKLTPAQTQTIKERVAKHIVAPQEEPVMAVVTSADALIKEQAFYAGVQNGDILLIYPQAGKAVLYSVSTDKLLNVGPVQVGDGARKGEETAAPATVAPQSPEAKK